MKDNDSSFMMKLGWGLVGSNETLWARVLRAKYDCGSGEIPKMVKKQESSRLWEGIVNSWDKVLEGFVWKVNDGLSVRFWQDAWVMGLSKLVDYSTASLCDEDLERKVADYVSEFGGWDRLKIKKFLNDEICDVVCNMDVASFSKGEDKLSWKFTSNGRFSAKSAFENCVCDNSVQGGSVWRWIWKWKGPQRVKTFMWLAV